MPRIVLELFGASGRDYAFPCRRVQTSSVRQEHPGGRGMASRPLLRGACSRLVNAIETSVGSRAYASSSASSRARGEARESAHVQQDGDRAEGSRTSTSASSSQEPSSSSQASSSSSSTRELYPGHRPLTMLQKSLLSLSLIHI